MKLNSEGRAKIRAYIGKQIKEAEEKHEIPTDGRIKLDKERLTELLFEEQTSEAGMKYKKIVWTEYGLSKIDLSEIDFSNVLWESVCKVDLSNSNAKIDFATSYSSFLNAQIMPVKVVNFDFENVDLKDANAHLIGYSSGSNYKGTNMEIQSLEGRTFINCNLEGFDFSKITLSSKVYNLSSVPTVCKGTNFTNTGITIEMESGDIPAVAEEIRLGHLYGCNVNAAYIPSAEESKKHKEKIMEEYERLQGAYCREFNTELLKLKRLKSDDDICL